MKKLMLAVTVFSCMSSLTAKGVEKGVKADPVKNTTQEVVHTASKTKEEVSPQQRVRNEIMKTGALLFFTKNKLYNPDGSPNYHQPVKVGAVCPGTTKYMLFDNRIYRVKDNVIQVTKKMIELEKNIINCTSTVSDLTQKIDKLKLDIDRNLSRVSSTYMSSSPSKNSFTDTSGTVNSTESYELSREAKKFIKNLERTNRENEREIRKMENTITLESEKVVDWTKLHDELTEKQNKFELAQDKFNDKQVKPGVAAESISTTTLEARLIKLKSIFQKGLISKEVYDEMTKSILKELF